MKSLSDYSIVQLRSVIAVREKLASLQGELDALTGGVTVDPPTGDHTPSKRKYRMTAAHKRKLVKALARARKIRWANAKSAKIAPKKRRRMSAAGRAAISAAAKARWAKFRVAKA